MQNLILDFLRVTESAAIASMPWIGSGNKIAADGAATDAMREALNNMKMEATVVIGEGEIDEAPMLYIGERVGAGGSHKVDIAVDPIEGTTPTVNGQSNAIAVIAAAPKGTLLYAPDMYMKKLAVGPRAKGKIDLNEPIEENIAAVAKANKKAISELNVLIQDRSRHHDIIDRIRNTGAKVHLFHDGDVIYSTSTCIETLDIDLFLGIGGAPEGVLGAVAVRCLGGEMQAKLMPQNDNEFIRCKEMGINNPNAILHHNQLVSTDDCLFVATGITNNLLVDGIKTDDNNYITHSALINGNEKKIRYVKCTSPLSQTVKTLE
ncbi:fructose-1,6-bisphosphatase II [Salinibacillus kushneri]|uniref:Fructose-1,6-bisphosphatase n=1 Tax=Salinibacillus kushneri TaxID=237682 RepID=A0A1H9ZAG1_9BACI|nr:class II fructose-bisphosphatase [Salinibacillus kushneri]SES78462.1 fructose-1,6-bisphosphatase II [Salinibacillus kushneri]